ncbi:DSBA-like thioredoxin domain protein [Talaromyces proteolyticus]|uniref:DSBA-like thioredoxin domain protein n=1 Tax=Talaromyces proteolyticus TaxID=1131652 RepID=A0AAD4Q1J9_9EURO|nr:DSBA-like thioredoxin domain protein [Talaromyces proteolyticus]KAH8698623.1 DSBA-like thioredoxin domain protein [Talaromyces proteolyticus]
MAIITIDIISDIVCAWCYIGTKSLEKAISIYQKTYPGGRNDIFVLTWRPYYLNYHASLTSIDKHVLAQTKLRHMTAEQRTALEQRMDRIGRAAGIVFRNGGKIGSTRPAHHLIALCQRQIAPGSAEGLAGGKGMYPVEVRDALVARLFEAYHELERDIASREVLREIAVDVGMDEAEVDGCLDACFSNGTGVEESSVDREARENKEAGTGVPLFIIQGVHRVEGAQDVMELVEIFGKTRENDEL